VSNVADPSVVFRTSSALEAAIVRGLLDAHGIETVVTSDGPQALFPSPAGSLGEVRVSVAEDDADDARELIEAYRAERSAPRLVPWPDDLTPLEQRLGHRFKDRDLLVRAVTHRSRAHEDAAGDGDAIGDNESLEFLGDAVLGLVVADVLFRQFPLESEGRKSKMKAALVSEPSLAAVAERIGLGEHLRLGRGEDRSGGRRKSAVIADACEAVIAAIYLDGGLEAARTFVERELLPMLDAVREPGRFTAMTGDFKSALQERLQAANASLPEYRLVGAEGPDHRKVFAVEVWSDGTLLARAEGLSKKEAEQRAAQVAMDKLEPPTRT
jgi:ribonuclease-3